MSICMKTIKLKLYALILYQNINFIVFYILIFHLNFLTLHAVLI